MNINEAIEQLKYYQNKPYVPTVRKVCDIAMETKERHIVRHCANCGAPVSTNKCYECGEEGTMWMASLRKGHRLNKQ